MRQQKAEEGCEEGWVCETDEEEGRAKKKKKDEE